MIEPIAQLQRCQTCGARITAVTYVEQEDTDAAADRVAFVPGLEYIARPCGHPLRWPVEAGVYVVPRPMCRHCGRVIELVDGVGWLHPDTRTYWVPQVEPLCEVAEPVDTPGVHYDRPEHRQERHP